MSPVVISVSLIVFSAILTVIIAVVTKMFDRMRAMEVIIAKLDTQVSPLWARVQAQIASDLHHPDSKYAEMDGLLERLQNLTITDFERKRLKVLLDERAVDFSADISDEQRSSAKLMHLVMDKVLQEKVSTAPTQVEAILVPVISSPGSGPIAEKSAENPDKK